MNRKARARQIAGNVARGAVAQIVAHPVAALIVACGLAATVWIYGGAFWGGVRAAFQDRKVERLQTQAHEAQAGAQTAERAADDTQIERTVEDQRRANEIAPAIERAGRTVAETSAEAQRARARYEQTQKNSRRDDLDDRVLHERNCADLAQLYPGERFRRCE